MKIFFLSSIVSEEYLRDVFRKIILKLEKQNCLVLYEHVFENPEKIQNLSSGKLEIRAKKLYKQMLQCDGLVFESTSSSTGAGFLLSQALNKRIPTLFLTQERYSGLYLADPNRLLQIKRYSCNQEYNLSKIIENFLKFAKKKRLLYRFNLMINESMRVFIDTKSKNMNISKADYLRNLVYREMQEDCE